MSIDHFWYLLLSLKYHLIYNLNVAYFSSYSLIFAQQKPLSVPLCHVASSAVWVHRDLHTCLKSFYDSFPSTVLFSLLLNVFSYQLRRTCTWMPSRSTPIVCVSDALSFTLPFFLCLWLNILTKHKTLSQSPRQNLLAAIESNLMVWQQFHTTTRCCF